MSTDNLFVITGGPGSGKTTLIRALQTLGYCCSEEAGRRIIQEQRAGSGQALPWVNPAQFVEAMFDLDLQSYRDLSRQPGPVFFDRGIPDLLGALALMGLPVPAHIQTAADRLRYNPLVFIAPPWPEIFTNDSERKQSFAEAERTCACMIEAYNRCGYKLIELPRLSVEARISFVLDHALASNENAATP